MVDKPIPGFRYGVTEEKLPVLPLLPGILIRSRLRAEKPRTTNELEGWHSGIRKLVGKDHPPFYESVENMWKMEALATKTQVDIVSPLICG